MGLIVVLVKSATAGHSCIFIGLVTDNASAAQQMLEVFHPADSEWKSNSADIDSVIKAM